MLIIQIVEKFIEENALFKDGECIDIAFSGGGDSVALLYILSALSQTHGYDLRAHHIRHGLRNDQADFEIASSVAGQLRVPFLCSELHLGTELHNTEATARERRYAAFYEAARRRGATAIALGHHGNDNLENMLWRLTRGCGTEGLTLHPQRPWPGSEGSGRLVRPLLCIGKTEILHLLRETGLPWAEDPTNAGDVYLRNRIRHHVVPAITALCQSQHASERNVDIGPESQMFRSLLRIYQNTCVVSALTENFISRMFWFNGDYYACRAELCELGYSAFAELLPRVARHILAGYVPDTGLRERAWQALSSPEKQGEVTDNRLAIIMGANSVRFCAKGRVQIFGEIPSQYLENAIKWENFGFLECQKIIFPDEVPPNTTEHFYLPASCVSGKCRVECCGRHKWFQTADGHRQKCSDILGQIKVPRALRNAWPVLCDDNGPLWIAGGPRAFGTSPATPDKKLYRISWRLNPSLDKMMKCQK